MRYVFIFIILTVWQLPVTAQGHEGSVWFFGSRGAISDPQFGGTMVNFSTNPPAKTAIEASYGLGGSSSLSDENGNLKMYTDGCAVYGADHEIILNGGDLSPISNPPGYFCGNSSQSQYLGAATMLLPWPNHNNKYVLIHSNTFDVYGTSFVYSSIIEEHPDGQREIIDKRDIFIGDTVDVNVFLSVRHGNGRDWWIVTHQFETNNYYIALLDSVGLHAPQLTKVSGGFNFVGGASQSCFSPDGTHFVHSDAFRAQVFNFNRCTGTLSDPTDLYNSIEYVSAGVAFSADSRFLYMVQQNELYQYDTYEPDYPKKRIRIGAYDGYKDEVSGYGTTFGFLQLAPDNKIYMSTAQGINLHVIQHPEKKGTACQFVQHEFKLLKLNNGIGSNNPNYRLGAVSPACDQYVYDSSYCHCQDTLPIAKQLTLYPNPATSEVKLGGPPGSPVPLTVEIYDALGRLLINRTFECLPGYFDVSDLPAAGYFYRIVNNGTNVKEGTLVRVNTN